MILVAEHGDDHDVARGILLRRLANDFDSATVGEAEVGEQDVGRGVREDRARGGAVRRDADQLELGVRADDVGEALCKPGFIFDEEDFDHL